MITKLEEAKIIVYLNKQFKKNREKIGSRELVKYDVLTNEQHYSLYSILSKYEIRKFYEIPFRINTLYGIIIFLNPDFAESVGIAEKTRKNQIDFER